MVGTIAVFVTVLISVCNGNIWSARPLYVIERFPLINVGDKADFPLKRSGSGIPFEVTPMETKLSEKASSAAFAKKRKTKSAADTPLPKLVKAISTDHKAKIKSLHTPCHQIGCLEGFQCVYDRMWMCPTYIPDLDCSCRPGCAVGKTFIPMGKTLTMDECGNKCSCRSKNGKAVCTGRKCEPVISDKEAKMDSLLKYLKKLVKIKLQDREKVQLQEKGKDKSSTPAPMETSASGNVQQRKTTSNNIKLSHKIDLISERRFPYNPRRLLYVTA